MARGCWGWGLSSPPRAALRHRTTKQLSLVEDSAWFNHSGFQYSNNNHENDMKTQELFYRLFIQAPNGTWGSKEVTTNRTKIMQGKKPSGSQEFGKTRCWLGKKAVLKIFSSRIIIIIILTISKPKFPVSHPKGKLLQSCSTALSWIYISI